MNTDPTKPFSWRTAAILSLSVGLLVAGLSVFLQSQGLTVPAFAAGAPAPATATTTPGVGASYDKPHLPVRLVIPAIGVDAAIQSVGLSWHGDGTMGIPSNFTDVAWYNGGPLPGAPGNAVIDGHLDGKDVQKAVFYNLADLKPGDIVEVKEQGGATLHFRVTGSKTYDYNATTTDIFFGDVSKARLNLITCTGDWVKAQKIYNKRIVVFTELVND